VADAKEMLDLVRPEGGYMYRRIHARKDRQGFPDRILTTDYFRDASYLGVGWEAMVRSVVPRLGRRVFDLLDEVNMPS